MAITGNALIFGGGSGIGHACAVAFAQQGAAWIVIADLQLSAAEKVVTEITSLATASHFRADAIEVDVTLEKSVESVVQQVARTLGRIDYCINSAGIGVQIAKPISEADVSEFERFLRVNAMGTFLVTKHLSAAMKAQEPIPVSSPAAGSADRGTTRGSIVNVGSLASFLPQPDMVQYTASKHAALGITRNAALDNAAHGIRINCLCPSWVDTLMVRQAVEGVPGLKEMIESVIPMRRIARPEEIADVALFLCSPAASYITGSSMIVDGGTSLAAKM
ncbi:NAD(P)-binding protein [Xylaria intraflava]|nr:NAD(P)-binding protein [Xylaria intraflava]